jgi:hypothetical protein
VPLYQCTYPAYLSILSFCPLIIRPCHRVQCWCNWPTNQDGRLGLLKRSPNHDNCTATPMNRLLTMGPWDRETGQDDQWPAPPPPKMTRDDPAPAPHPCKPLLAGWIAAAGNQRQTPTPNSAGDNERMTMRSGTTDTGTAHTTDPGLPRGDRATGR